MKPQTLMNASGEAVGEAARYYHIPPERVLVIVDDVALPVGALRIRREGSPGGHNGLKSIEAHLGSPRYPRIKIGVGEKPGAGTDLADHVLGALPPADLRAVTALFDDIYAAAALIIEGRIDQAMNAYNHNGGKA